MNGKDKPEKKITFNFKDEDDVARPYIDDGSQFGVKGVERGSCGGSKFVDKEELQKQKGVLSELMKNLSNNLFKSNLLNISLPVRIFEPRSFLERITDTWCFAPLYLRRASLSKDPIERLKWVVTFAISGLHQGVKQMKPFNPILGETWQAQYADGTHLFFEQTSHHPPISSFQVFGAKNLFVLHGHHEYTASFKAEGIIGGQVGPNNVDFPDGTRITFQNPYVQLSGFLWGDRMFNWIDKGPVPFVDEKNNLRCELKFNPDGPQGISSYFSTGKTPIDSIRGKIIPNDKKNLSDPPVLCKVEGSWLENVRFDDKIYWSNKEYQPFFPTQVLEDVLPSDSRFRADLVALRAGDLETAQKAKGDLEVMQRKDKKLRKEMAKHQHT